MHCLRLQFAVEIEVQKSNWRNGDQSLSVGCTLRSRYAVGIGRDGGSINRLLVVLIVPPALLQEQGTLYGQF